MAPLSAWVRTGPKDAAMLHQSLTYQLISIAEDALELGRAAFEGRFGLNVHELRVLRLVGDNPGITFTRLAAGTKFARSDTSRILSRLVKAGLIRRKISAEDARRFDLYITAKGTALRAAADPLSLELESLLLKPLPEAERAAFVAALDTLSAWVAGDFDAEMQRFLEARSLSAPAPAARRLSR